MSPPFSLAMNSTIMSSPAPSSVDATLELLTANDYVAERRLATAVFLALKLQRPLFLEGEAGVGKTEIAKVLAKGLGRPLVRLQCYEGLDTASAVYEWNYPRQMIEIRLAEATGNIAREDLSRDIFTRRFLLKRPLLQAIDPDDGVAPVLLIDELDRTDEPFEAYLLEVLSDFQITIPEMGTIVKAKDATDRDNHLQPHARDSRRNQAPLPVPLGGLSGRVSASSRSCAANVHAHRRRWRGKSSPLRKATALDGPVQGAWNRGNAGLGRGAVDARPHCAGPAYGRGYPRCAAQVSG